MNIVKPELLSGDKVPLAMTHPRHMAPSGPRSASVRSTGAAVSALGTAVGSEAVVRAGSFEDAMLQAIDSVNQDQNLSTELVRDMVTDPDSVDAHDVTTAMAKASLSLNITRTVLDRIVRGWKEIINTR